MESVEGEAEKGGVAPSVETPKAAETFQSLDIKFADRYSIKSERYTKVCEGFEPVVIMHPWPPQSQKRPYDNRPGDNRNVQQRSHANNRYNPYRNHQGNYQQRDGSNYNGRWNQRQPHQQRGHGRPNQRF